MPDAKSFTFTIFEYLSCSTVQATSIADLARKLYNRTSWTRAECRRVAGLLFSNRVFLSLDYETVMLPGLWEITESRPEERADWPSTDAEPPLLSGGFK